ncbi:ROK family glucokinase [Virgibacillus litoralis]|uniref:Glucokinase n=1 Tax=Virgibacillus litoralis TaxID=578221 RepID=A0ABS4HHE2_9BACI|nr:ROK family glucokinase [Virgibacillus litoralis]MBP1950349.1 glucokinase [Virgibacillus litoralis]
MDQNIIGIDVGGTTIKIGIISEAGNILDKWEIPTNITDSGTSILTDIWSSLRQKIEIGQLKRDSIAGIGLGAPGFIHEETGSVYEAVNIGWKNMEIATVLKKLSKMPVYVQNDANIAVLGENWRGAGEQSRNLIAITLGTGVGGGIIANGTILNGENGTAGEIGHITVEKDGYRCNCGRRGCLETIASATGIVRQAKNIIVTNPTSRLASFYQENGSLTTKDIFELANNGDALSKEVIDHTADVLGLVIANLATIINPSKILIGGGVSKAGEGFINSIDGAFREYALDRVSEVCDLKVAQLGNDAGIIGAAFLVKQKIMKTTF